MTVTREDDDMTAAATAPDQGAAGTTPEGALSQLIREANDAGITYQEMADRGITPEGHRLPRQWYQKLVKTPPVNPPSVPHMHAIAAAIRKPLRTIQEAAAHQWLMYETTELAALGDTVRIIVSHLATMPESEKRKWQAMIEAAERARRESGE
ncbi:hypothetical protein [Streptomyces griseoluteus]